MEPKETSRGFKYFEFIDKGGNSCSLQKSSSSGDLIWLGVDDANPKILESKIKPNGIGWVEYPIPEYVLLTTRMHLTRDQVEKLIPILQNFVDTGEI